MTGPSNTSHNGQRPPGEHRTEATLPLGDILERLAERWGKLEEYRIWLLRERWGEVLPEAWAQAVRPERVDGEGRLVVSVPYSSGVKMELQRKGRRWRQLLDGCCRVSGMTFSDLILEDHRRRPRTKKG